MTQQAKTGRGRRVLWIAGAVLAVLVVIAAGAVVWYLNRDVPEAVSLDRAVAGVTETTDDEQPPQTTTSTDPTITTTTTTPVPEGIDGAWEVDTSVGSFSFAESTASFAGFRVNEELSRIGATTAVGRTPVVVGMIEFSGSTLTSASIEADLSQIVTNESRRDRRVKQALDTATFPIAAFTITTPIDLEAVPEPGEQIVVTAAGDLTIKGITRSVQIPLEAQLVDDLIVVVGSIDIVFADFDVSVPSAPVVLSADDHGIVEMQLFFRRGLTTQTGRRDAPPMS